MNAAVIELDAARAQNDGALLDAYSRAVIQVVDAVGPAVVNLGVRKGRWSRRGPLGQGSGVLVAPDGYLLTNSHVADGAGKIEVTFADGSQVGARLVGDDPATDLALLRTDATGLPFAPLAEAVRPRQGQLAIAMGNPLGFQSTVSTGVVSALGRSLRSNQGRLIDDVVQHTAPLNPGNSGGPLLDSSGRIIGINTAIIAFSQGIGFAVPAPTAAWVVGELLAHGRVRRAVLGIAAQVRPIARRLAKSVDLDGDSCIEVAGVEKGSAAERAGIHEGDRLLAFAGRPTPHVDDLHRALRDHKPGDPAKVAILRGATKLDLEVTPHEAK